MIQAADYRRRAEDCARRAEEAQDDYHRQNFQQLADMWNDMADKAEIRAPLVAHLAAGSSGEDVKALSEALETIRAVRAS